MSALHRILRWGISAFCLAAAPGAWAALGCTISASPSAVGGVYASAANLDVQGSLSLTCTRDPSLDPRKPDVWIGIAQTTGGLTMTRDVGGSTLGYFIYRFAAGNSVWLNSGSKRPNQSGDAGLLLTLDFGAGGASAVTTSVPFYWRVPSGQTRPAGVYLDSGPVVTVRQDSETGGALATTTIGSRASIQHDCRFSSPPAPIALAYTAFSPSAVLGSTNFGVTCTQGTNYTLSLDLTRSVVPDVNLAYSLSLSASSSTGIATEQAYTLNVSIDAGQPGNCAAPPCQGTDIRTITVTY